MKRIYILTICGLLAATMSANAQYSGNLENGLSWQIADGTLTISKTGEGTGEMLDYTLIWNDSDYVIDAPWSEHQSSFTALVIEPGVTSIGAFAFYNHTNITGSLTLPEGITSIGNSAFSVCSGFNGSLTLPEGLTGIGDHAFYACSGFIGSLTLPEGITNISEYTFWGCSGFNGTLTLPEGLTSIGSMAFNNCSGFTGSLTLPEGLTSIGGFAFDGCYGFNGSLTLPEGLKSIGFYAFIYCSGFTGSLTLPETLTSIGDYAFNGCSGFTGSLTFPEGLTKIEYSSFNGCSGFNGSLSLPKGITSIGRGAFAGCSGFTEVINHTTTPVTIEPSTFGSLTIGSIRLQVPEGCVDAYSSATVWEDFGCISAIGGIACEINLPKSGIDGEIAWRIDEVSNTLIISRHSGNGAMPDYTYHENNNSSAPWAVLKNSFNTLIIEPGVTSIGNYAFYLHNNFTGSLILPEGITRIGDMAFSNYNGRNSFTGTLTLPEGLTSIGKWAFACCRGFTGSLIFPEGIESVGSYAFLDCNGFTGSLTLPEGLMGIGEGAFANCYGFTGSLTLPEGLMGIGEGAFANCYGFTGSLTFPEGLTYIGREAFYDCNGFTGSLIFPEGIESVGSYAFLDCNGFTGSLTFPEGLTYIGRGAFYGCSGFMSVINFNSTPQSINDDVFSGITLNNITLHVPGKSIPLYQSAAVWQNFGQTVYVEDFVVTFEPLNGIAPFFDYVYSNEPVSSPLIAGYTYDDWYMNGEKWNFDTPVTESITLTAHLMLTPFNIIYVLNGGANHLGNPDSYTIESPDITLQNPTREGYTFANWAEDSSIVSGSTGDKTFTAEWDIIHYDITYHLNGGTNHPDNPVIYTIEDNITLQNPTRENYTFVNWAEGNNIETGSKGDRTFTAQWNIISYNAEITNAIVVSIYPNPADNMVTLEFEKTAMFIITLSDLSGKTLLHQMVTGQTVRLDISAYPAGVYLITINDGKQRSTTRIVKN